MTIEQKDGLLVCRESFPVESVLVDFDLPDNTLRQLSCERSVQALSYCACLAISVLLGACNFKKKTFIILG